MRRPFVLVKVGRFRRSAARGMARAGFAPLTVSILLRLPLAICQDIHAGRHAPAGLWSAAERALFKGAGR